MQIRIKLSPNARQNQIIGWENDPVCGRVLKVRIQAAPVEGKANKALEHFLAESLRISKSKVQLIKGDESRIKTLLLPDSTELPDW